jgi:hypothetical protein
MGAIFLQLEVTRVNMMRYATDSEESETTPLIEGYTAAAPPAWEMIETGRYRPRRIRGSLLGRELG